MISEDASAKKTGVSSANSERRSSSINWEAMSIALEKLRIHSIAGRIKEVEDEIIWMQDQLHRLYAESKRTYVVEDERKGERK